MKVPMDREQVCFEDWNEAAMRRIINQQRKITETSKLKMKRLYQILFVIDGEADSGYLNKKTAPPWSTRCSCAAATSKSAHSSAPRSCAL